MQKKFFAILLALGMVCGATPLMAGNPADLTAINPDLMITAAEAQAWHETKASFGPTDSGGPGWQQYYAWVTKAFEDAGAVGKLEHSFQYDLFTIDDWQNHSEVLGLTLDPAGAKIEIPVASFTMNSIPMSGYTGYTTAPLAYYDSSSRTAPTEGQFAGKIMVVETWPYDARENWGTSFWTSYTLTDHEFRTGPGPFPNLYDAVDPAVDNSWHTRWEFSAETTMRTWAITAGAAGMIIVSDLPWNNAKGLHQRTNQFDIPSLFLDRDNGAQVVEYAKANPGTEATIKLLAEYQNVTTSGVMYFLPGVNYGQPNDEYVVVASHTDSMALTQDNGVLGILGVYKYFAEIPQAERPRTLLFYVDNRHFMTGGEAAWPNDDLFVYYPELIEKCIAQVSLEHMGQLEGADRMVNGEFTMVPTGNFVYSFIGTPSNEAIIDTIIQAVTDNDLPRADVKALGRPGVNGGWQMSVKSLTNAFRQQSALVGKPYVNLAGNWPGAHTQIFSSLDWFSAEHFVNQIATMSQVVGYFMTADTREISLFWGQMKDSIRNLAVEDFEWATDRSAMMNQCDQIFESVQDGEWAGALSGLQSLKADVAGTIAASDAKTGLLATIDNAIALID